MKRMVAIIVIILLLIPLNQSKEAFKSKSLPSKEDVFGFILALQKRMEKLKFNKDANLIEEIIVETGKIDYATNNSNPLKDAIKEFYEAEGIEYDEDELNAFLDEATKVFTTKQCYAIALLLFSYSHVLEATSRREEIENVIELYQNVRKTSYLLDNCSLNESVADKYNAIIFGSIENSMYNEYKFIIDFGGNDFYMHNNNSFLLDLKGEDEYKSNLSYGINLIFDLAGNDSYNDFPHVINSINFLFDLKGNDEYYGRVASSYENGMAILIDIEGNDIYEGENFTQGYSEGGVSLLMDIRGDDIYKASSYCQASGEKGGIACVADFYGNDAFFAKDYAQAYANGLEHRSAVIFLNLAGNDYYDAENFCQGYGEQLGVAIFCDFIGDDVYYAKQFSQASSSFMGVAALLDVDGRNKFYSGLFSQGNKKWGGYSFFLNKDFEDIYGVIDFISSLNINLWDLLSNFL